MKKQESSFSWLYKSYRLIIRNEDDFSEKSNFHFTYARLIAASFLLFIFSLVISTFLVNRVLAMWLHPTYMERESKRKVKKLSTLVASLEEQLDQQTKFITVLQSTITGEKVPQEATQGYQSLKKEADDYAVVSEKQKVAQLPKELPVELPTEHPLEKLQSTKMADFFPFNPVLNGIVTRPFSKETEHFGIDVVGREKEPIKCIADGIVLMSSWTLDTGWVIGVQHKGNMVSVYKHNSALLKKVGNFVQRGEVIAIIGESGELSSGPHLHLELWHNGDAVNPEDFIIF